MDFTGPSPLGSQAALLELPQLRRVPDVTAIDPGRRSDGAGTDTRQRPQQDQTAAAARDIVALRRETSQRDLPVGPPPAFEVSLLEMEADLKHVLAQVEAARANARNADALRVEAADQEAAATAEAKGLSQTTTEAKAASRSPDDTMAPDGTRAPATDRPSFPLPTRTS